MLATTKMGDITKRLAYPTLTQSQRQVMIDQARELIEIKRLWGMA